MLTGDFSSRVFCVMCLSMMHIIVREKLISTYLNTIHQLLPDPENRVTGSHTLL